MAALSTHLVVGERVFPQIQELRAHPDVYDAFLLGCVLVDVNLIAPIDRRLTHFCDGFYGQGAWAYDQSCANMLAQRDRALCRPWPELSPRERAFVAGWLCHLAADEAWKAFCWRLLGRLGLARWSALPLPGGVFMTAYHVLSVPLFADRGALVQLSGSDIPDVLRHIPHHVLARMWDIVGPHVLDGRTPASFYGMLERMGTSEAEIRAVRENHERWWERALSFVQEQEDIESLVASGVARSLEVIPHLWQAEAAG